MTFLAKWEHRMVNLALGDHSSGGPIFLTQKLLEGTTDRAPFWASGAKNSQSLTCQQMLLYL